MRIKRLKATVCKHAHESQVQWFEQLEQLKNNTMYTLCIIMEYIYTI